MRFIEPTLYASQRSLPELALLAATGAVALVEPMTWPGVDRRFPETYMDDFERLLIAESRRALTLRLGYAACLGVGAREARQSEVAARVIALMPRFLGHERVAAIGEIGLEHGDEAEVAVFAMQARLARHHQLPLVIRLPEHDRARVIARMVALLADEGVAPETVLVNGAREEDLAVLQPLGCWLGLSVGGACGLAVEEAVHLIARAGPERLMVHSAAGRLDGAPLVVPQTARRMLALGFRPERVAQVIYHNPKAFFSKARPLAVIEPGRQARTGDRPLRGDADDRLMVG
jgi:predicted metal-dependent TIM-barrel fold hydrolase